MAGLGNPKTGGRQKGIKNKSLAIITQQRAEMINEAFASGVSAVEVMLANMRRAFGRASVLAARLEKMVAANHPEDQDWANALTELWNNTDRAQRYARDVAPFFHPQLAAVKHDHRTQDGQVIRPVIVIEGYPTEPLALPAPVEAAPASIPEPPLVVPGNETRN
jgi:hypothetical protein